MSRRCVTSGRLRDSTSNLYIRVRTGFYSHKKTIALFEKVGKDAFWIPPRLWAYAAENQPDGDMSKYSSNTLAMILGCLEHSISIKDYLTDSCFLDKDGKIHGWEEHNGYHDAYSKRGKNAANKRWERYREKRKRKGKKDIGKGTEHCISNAKAQGTIDEAVAYCVSLGLPTSDGEYFFNQCVSMNWTTNGEPIRDWRAKIRAWKAANYMPSQKQKNGQLPLKPRQENAI